MEKFVRTITRENLHNVLALAGQQADKLLDGGVEVKIEIRPKRRSDEQNAKLHAMLSDIAKKKTFNGQQLNIEQWKMVFVSGHKIATGSDAQMAIGLEGEVINLRESTAKMSIKRLCSLIEYIDAWAAQNGVVFYEYPAVGAR